MTGARPTPVLPRLLVLTDRRSVPAGGTLLGTIRAAVEAGARAVVVRERDLPSAQRAVLADACDRLLDVVGGVCIVADPDPRSAAGTPSDGLHLRAASRLPAVRPDLLGRSAHSLDEVVRAAADGLDYVTVSPVAPSPSNRDTAQHSVPTGCRPCSRAPPGSPAGPCRTRSPWVASTSAPVGRSSRQGPTASR